MILRKIYPLKISTLIPPFFCQQPVADIRILFWVPKLSVQINDKELRKNLICSNLRGVNIIVCRGGSGSPFISVTQLQSQLQFATNQMPSYTQSRKQYHQMQAPNLTLVCRKSNAFLHLEQKIVSSAQMTALQITSSGRSLKCLAGKLQNQE